MISNKSDIEAYFETHCVCFFVISKRPHTKYTPCRETAVCNGVVLPEQEVTLRSCVKQFENEYKYKYNRYPHKHECVWMGLGLKHDDAKLPK